MPSKKTGRGRLPMPTTPPAASTTATRWIASVTRGNANTATLVEVVKDVGAVFRQHAGYGAAGQQLGHREARGAQASQPIGAEVLEGQHGHTLYEAEIEVRVGESGDRHAPGAATEPRQGDAQADGR